MSYTVRYEKDANKKTGRIMINNIAIETSSFFMTNGFNNDDDVKFTKEQAMIRCLDCMKDGDVKDSTSIRNSVPQILDYKEPISFSTLDEIENMVYEKNNKQNYIKKDSWTKKTKESVLEPMLENRVIFKESGLGPESYINPKPVLRFVGNIATEVIDPAGRSPIEPKDIRFPENGNTLILDESFLQFFGFNNCSVVSTRNQTPKNKDEKYTYTIRIGDITIDRQETVMKSNGKNVTVDWFQGNKEKNNFIASNIPDTKIKRGLLIAKEMGDVLQVLIMLIWHKLNKDLYSITTGDKVVFLLCMLLELNCIYLGKIVDKTEKQGKKKGGDDNQGEDEKKRYINIYEPKIDPLLKAKTRFNSLKTAILDDNSAIIEAIRIFKQQNPNISGRFETMRLVPIFYDKIMMDLTNINNILRNEIDITNIPDNMNEIDKINEINKRSNEIKENFTFKNLFRTNNAKKGANKKREQSLNLDTTLSRYTQSDRLWKNRVDPSYGSYKYGAISFYNLGVNMTQRKSGYIYPPQDQSQQLTSTTVNGRRRGGGDDFKTLHYLDYPEGAFYYDKDTERTFDLYDELERQIEEYLKIRSPQIQAELNKYTNQIKVDEIKVDETMYFNEVYNELLHHFYLIGEVLYDQELNAKIEEILAMCLYTDINMLLPQFAFVNNTKQKPSSAKSKKYTKRRAIAKSKYLKKMGLNKTSRKRSKYDSASNSADSASNSADSASNSAISMKRQRVQYDINRITGF
jgi:hypothetical protein